MCNLIQCDSQVETDSEHVLLKLARLSGSGGAVDSDLRYSDSMIMPGHCSHAVMVTVIQVYSGLSE